MFQIDSKLPILDSSSTQQLARNNGGRLYSCDARSVRDSIETRLGDSDEGVRLILMIVDSYNHWQESKS